jgi:GNAT superfamily N-acetyltransferase
LSAYRFCRTDDIGLLVDALNRCWAPAFPADPPMTAAAFKRSIRDLQVWCSSCMVAFAGADPIGVLIGAKRATATFIHKIAVHPDHQRQGHGRHLLASLSSKLAILGPPRIVTEVPETLTAARALFSGSGYVEEAVLTDYIWRAASLERALRSDASRVVIPVTVDDLAANGLLEEWPPTCWARSVETLAARKDEIEGLAVASDERLEAYVLYIKDSREILSMRAMVQDEGERLADLLSLVRARGGAGAGFAKVHPAEMPKPLLEALGFHPAGGHLVYATNARSN